MDVQLVRVMVWTPTKLNRKEQQLFEELAEHENGKPPEGGKGFFDRVKEVYEERAYPHGPGSKGAEMIAALEDAGCQRYYPQVFLDEDDLSDFDVILDAYAG